MESESHPRVAICVANGAPAFQFTDVNAALVGGVVDLGIRQKCKGES
jgi:hypothetical protein